MESNFDIHQWQAKHLKKESLNEQITQDMDFESSSQIQAVINYLIDNDHQDVLDMLGKIPEWNELVTQAADY
jgi:hypothetical protein